MTEVARFIVEDIPAEGDIVVKLGDNIGVLGMSLGILDA